MMKLRSQSSDFRSKQSASKGRSSFSPGSTSPKEEDDEEEEEEDVNEEEEEEEEDVNEDEDQDEVVVPPKKKQAYKASTPLSSSSSSAPLRRRCVTVKVHGTISTSTSVPSKAAQPKSDNIQDNNPQEQGNAIGTMSSSTSSAKVDRPHNSHIPDEIQLPQDGQEAKFEAEIDL